MTHSIGLLDGHLHGMAKASGPSSSRGSFSRPCGLALLLEDEATLRQERDARVKTARIRYPAHRGRQLSCAAQSRSCALPLAHFQFPMIWSENTAFA
jgi:hypothetical protein